MYSNKIILAILNKESNPTAFDKARSEIITSLIREIYTIDEEFSIQRTRDEKPEKFKVYNDRVKDCIRKADEEFEAAERLIKGGDV